MDKEIKCALYGALIGDYYGSYWECHSKPKTKEEALAIGRSCFSDDSYMTLALAKCFNKYAGEDKEQIKNGAIFHMREIGRKYPAGYGGAFWQWLHSDTNEPYFSWGNGGSMRVSSAGLCAKNIEEARENSNIVTGVTHNHPYGLTYAEIVAELVFLSKSDNVTMEQLDSFLKENHPNEYEIIDSLDMDDLHEHYFFDSSSQGSVPQALHCFLKSKSFDECLFNCLYIGGDTDTISAIACSIAAPFYGDAQVKPFVDRLPKLDGELNDIIKVFSLRYLC